MNFDPQKWGPFVVAMSLITLMWFVAAFALFKGISDNAQSNMIVGAVITGFATGYGFYLNSSSSSKGKDISIERQATALAGGPPPPPPGTTTTTIVTPPTPPTPAPVAAPIVTTIVEPSAPEPARTSQS